MRILRVSSKNAAYQKMVVLLTNRAKRNKYGEFILEGVRNINEAIKNNWDIISFIHPSKEKLSKWAANMIGNHKTKINFEVADELLSGLSGKDDTSELMAIVKMRDNSVSNKDLSPNPIIVLFDNPSNKGNLGTLFRSCDAFGVERLIITGHAIDAYEPEVITASMGSFFKIPFVYLSESVHIHNHISKLKHVYPDLKVIGTTEVGTKPVYDIDMAGPVLLLLGNEKNGLNKQYLKISDERAAIPMSGKASASSLNVSCAATVVLYEVIRQRIAGTKGE
jgi:TrmH family RNA methyltransferase